ncbi:hypothetical protein MW887_009398 [Aspergillus wentii]|nr:hypothetical protein MW887_009398 [Aspergillus wentii]
MPNSNYNYYIYIDAPISPLNPSPFTTELTQFENLTTALHNCHYKLFKYPNHHLYPHHWPIVLSSSTELSPAEVKKAALAQVEETKSLLFGDV